MRPRWLKLGTTTAFIEANSRGQPRVSTHKSHEPWWSDADHPKAAWPKSAATASIVCHIPPLCSPLTPGRDVIRLKPRPSAQWDLTKGCWHPLPRNWIRIHSRQRKIEMTLPDRTSTVMCSTGGKFHAKI